MNYFDCIINIHKLSITHSHLPIATHTLSVVRLLRFAFQLAALPWPRPAAYRRNLVAVVVAVPQKVSSYRKNYVSFAPFCKLQKSEQVV